MNNSCFTGFHHLKPAYKINNFFFCQCQSNNNDKIDVDVCRIANKCIHEKSLDFGHSNSRSRLDIWQTFNEQILKHRRKRISIKVLETSAIPVDSNKKKKISDRPSSPSNVNQFLFAPLFSHRFVKLHYTFAI